MEQTAQPEKTPQLPVSEQEVQIQAPSFREKIQAQKKKILIGLGVFFGILILVGAVFGIYKYAQNQIPFEPAGEPTPEVATPTPDPTAEWQTYVNEEYGYSIKYPQEVTVTTDDVQDLVSFKFPEEGKWVADLSVRHYQNPEGLNPQAFYQKSFNEGKLEAEKKNWPPPPEPLKSETIKIDNLEGFQVRNSAYEAYQRTTYLGQGETMVAISFYDENPNDPAQEKHLASFNLMLSTFKFLDQNQTDETANWETFSDEKYGFAIKYPSDWVVKVQDSTVLFSENGPSGSRIGFNSPQKTMFGDNFWLNIYRISQASEQTALDNFKIFHAGDPCLDCGTQGVRLGNEDFLKVAEQKGGYIGYIKIRNGKYFEISYMDPGVQILNEQIEQILSTFQFVD